MNPYRNPVHLVGIDRTPALVRLLRACGTEETCITGRASDYEKFAALAVVMPLCEGHPETERVQDLLTQATGLTAPLCPHTVGAYWEAWVTRHWYGESDAPSDLPAVCPHCTPPSPLTLHKSECIQPSDPSAIQASDLLSWSRVWENYCTADDRPLLLPLPEDYVFVRPDPYHAGLAVQKAAGGEALTVKERDLLVTQALRVWGLALRKKPEGKNSRDKIPPVILEGGTPEALVPLLMYLQLSDALPYTIWIPHDPTCAEAVSGLYATVKTGYTVSMTDLPEDVEDRRRAYAAVAPIGAAVILVK
jgi:hypothetical protein